MLSVSLERGVMTMESIVSVARDLESRIDALASTADSSLTVRELVAGAYAAGALHAVALVAGDCPEAAGVADRLREAFSVLRHPSSWLGVGR